MKFLAGLLLILNLTFMLYCQSKETLRSSTFTTMNSRINKLLAAYFPGYKSQPTDRFAPRKLHFEYNTTTVEFRPRYSNPHDSPLQLSVPADGGFILSIELRSGEYAGSTPLPATATQNTY